MIELLVKYIQDKGYRVRVMSGILFIYKNVRAEICGVYWAISKYDLTPDLEECLYYQAHRKMNAVDQAIAERYGCSVGRGEQ